MSAAPSPQAWGRRAFFEAVYLNEVQGRVSCKITVELRNQQVRVLPLTKV